MRQWTRTLAVMKKRYYLGILFVSLAILWIALSGVFRLSPLDFLKLGLQVFTDHVMAVVYSADYRTVRDITGDYRVGNRSSRYLSSIDSWKDVERQIPGFRILGESGQPVATYDIPFVYEKIDTPYLVALRERYHLESIVKDAVGEYDAMLRLGAWVGSRWDHGIDPPPGGEQVCYPIKVIQAGEAGARLNCDTAARLTVHAATALGWPARLVTASRDGYTWEHAVVELWSNEYKKWFVIDTDFNVVYEADEAPLSAFELCHQGLELQKSGLLQTRYIAPSKPSLRHIDLMPFYNYVHIDMRNDWCSRPLVRGSPAGGDLGTWWTSRPSLNALLTAKRRVDDPALFNWAVNWVSIYALSAKRASDGLISIEIGLAGYSPTFKAFEISFDDGGWHKVEPGYVLIAGAGEHIVRARLLTISGYTGPVSEVSFHVSSAGEQFSGRSNRFLFKRREICNVSR
jgi:hypothetical protein